MVSVEEVAVEGSHRLSLSALMEVGEPTSEWIVRITVLLTVAVLIIAVVDLARRGKARASALAFTRMLSALAPMLGAVGSASCVVSAALLAMNSSAEAAGVWPPYIALAAFVMSVCVVCGCLGVVLTTILQIDSVRGVANRRD